MSARASGGRNLESQVGFARLANNAKHARGILRQIDFAHRQRCLPEQRLQFSRAAMTPVEARLKVIDVPTFGLKGVEHCGHVGTDLHRHAGVADALEVISDALELAALECPVGGIAMMRQRDAVAFGERI